MKTLAILWADCGLGQGEPERVHLLLNHPVTEVQGIAVGVYWDGHHVGILHRQPEGIRFLHLCHHKILVNGLPRASEIAFWVPPKLNPALMRQMGAQCRLFAFTGAIAKFPYAFTSPMGFFRDGIPNEFTPDHLGEGRLGLTCASFVLAIFDLIGKPLVNYWTWAIREDDKKWRTDIINKMFADMGQAHADSILVESGPRYKPLEVAAAASASKNPTCFGTAIRLARKLEKHAKKPVP